MPAPQNLPSTDPWADDAGFIGVEKPSARELTPAPSRDPLLVFLEQAPRKALPEHFENVEQIGEGLTLRQLAGGGIWQLHAMDSKYSATVYESADKKALIELAFKLVERAHR